MKWFELPSSTQLFKSESSGDKKKLILHRASMKYYEEYLKLNNFKVNYCEYKKKPSYKHAYMFDPIDKIEIKGILEILETPNFLMTKENYAEYKSNKKEVYMFHWFYTWGKTMVDIIPDIKSGYDTVTDSAKHNTSRILRVQVNSTANTIKEISTPLHMFVRDRLR